jgi:hypothetical protein
MFSDNDILDAPQSAKKPPADTKTEKTMYISIILFQYFLIIVGLISIKSEFFQVVFIASLIAAILHVIINILQFFSSIVGYLNTKDPKKLVHFILLILCFVLGFWSIANDNMAGFFLIIMPNGLAWFYVYILHAQQKERERLLPPKKNVKKAKR